MSHFKDLTGKRFGKLKVISRSDTVNKQVTWVCKCNCGNSITARGNSLKSGYTKSCGCSRNPGHTNPQWKGYKEIPSGLWYNINLSARNRGHRVAISQKYIWDLFIAQNRKCKLTNLDIAFGTGSKKRGTASLDRIDSSLGYVKGNVQWLHKDINKMKNTFTEDYFKELCKAVVRV